MPMTDERRYIVLFDARQKTYAIVDRSDGGRTLMRSDEAETAYAYRDHLNARHEKEQQQLAALARASGRPQ